MYEVGLKNRNWLLEEGAAAYEATKFSAFLSHDEYFREDADTKMRLLKLQEDAGGLKNGRLKLCINDLTRFEIWIDHKYLFLLPKECTELKRSFLLSANTLLAGTLFEILLSKYKDMEKEFLDMIYRARNDPRETSKLSRMIDSRWPEGTYSRLSACSKEEKAICTIINDLGSKA